MTLWFLGAARSSHIIRLTFPESGLLFAGLLDEIRDAYNLHEQTYISEEEEFESYVKPE